MENFEHIPDFPIPQRDAGRTFAPDSAAAFACERLGFVPDAKQRLVLESRLKREMLLCSRQ